MALKVSLAAWDHDRVAAVHDGRAGVPGVEIDGHILPISRLFPLAVRDLTPAELFDPSVLDS